MGLALAPTAGAASDSATRTQHAGRDNSIVVDCRRPESKAPADAFTLQRALAAAAADLRDNVIRFDPAVFGTGEAPIELDSPIRIDDPTAGNDCIDGSLSAGEITLDATRCSEAAVIVGGRGQLTLRRLTIAGPVPRPLLVKQDGRIQVERVTLRGSDGPGITLLDRASGDLRNCLLTGNHTHGIELRGRSSAAIRDTAAAGNGQSGLAAFDDAQAEVLRCRMSSNGDWNLVISQRSHVSWQEGFLGRARFAQADVSESGRLVMTGATLEAGERFGIFATGRAAVVANDCTLTGHAGRGIELQDDATIHLAGTRIRSSGDYGLLLFGRSRIAADDCTIASNGAHGASLRGKASGEFRECSFVGNKYSGVGALDAADGGSVEITQCRFESNGMRPIYRGPLHLDPLAPTPLRIEGPIVRCLAGPNARIELYLDAYGEGRRYFKTVRADRHGRFEVDCRDVPAGMAMAAAATVDRSTSEFNVIAGPTAEPILAALLAQTGPLSDTGEEIRADARMRRWPAGTHLVFEVANPPSAPVQRYVRFLTEQVRGWTGGAVTAEARFGAGPSKHARATTIPVRYLPTESSTLRGRGGVTFLKWDPNGWLVQPMEILLATPQDPREACPRVLAHEIGHTLGLCHTSMGLLSRMQGAVPPRHAGLVNDFSPMLTFYDVQALQILYDRRLPAGASLADLARSGLLPEGTTQALAHGPSTPAQPTFSPTAPTAPTIGVGQRKR